MRAIVLAGGKGTRLRPYTTLIPKPLVPIGGKYSILEILIMQLKNQGFTHVTLAVNHLSNLIMAYFGDGGKWGINIDYSIEEFELSTIGPLTLIHDLPNNFLVINGDILCDLEYGKFLQAHAERSSEVTVASFVRTINSEFGVLESDAHDFLTGFKEKPIYSFQVSMGVYAINRCIVDSLSVGQKYGFDNLMHDSLIIGRKVSLHKFSGFWLDIGRPSDYDYANENHLELFNKIGVPA